MSSFSERRTKGNQHQNDEKGVSQVSLQRLERHRERFEGLGSRVSRWRTEGGTEKCPPVAVTSKIKTSSSAEVWTDLQNVEVRTEVTEYNYTCMTHHPLDKSHNEEGVPRQHKRANHRNAVPSIQDIAKASEA